MAKSQQAARTDFHPTSAPAPILIGFDGTDGGRDALELGRVLNAIQGSPTIVATPHVTGLAEEARSALGDPAAETQEIGVLLPAMMLVESAKRHHAGTLVVGSTRRGRVGRVLLGSDIEQILHRTMGDVVVAPNGYASKRHPGFSRVVIAVPKPASEPVLARGEELARQAGAPSETIPVGGSNDGGWWHSVRSAASAIAEACEPDTDILVVGWRNRMDHFRVGSVTKHVIAEVPCPVLVVDNGN